VGGDHLHRGIHRRDGGIVRGPHAMNGTMLAVAILLVAITIAAGVFLGNLIGAMARLAPAL
jgi:hypothetical protein